MISFEEPLYHMLIEGRADRVPLWMMRQAGRYLPEYRGLRQRAGSFLDFCLNPVMASEATLQPLQRFDLDAAIVFADILLVPLMMGQRLVFEAQGGPKLDPVRSEGELGALKGEERPLEAVCETIERVRGRLPPGKSLIGFAGSPWTIACYMVEGQGGAFPTMMRRVATDRVFVLNLVRRIEGETISYLCQQVRAGAGVLQLFDSWAGLLWDEADFLDFVVEPTRRIVSQVKALHPNVPILGFPRGVSARMYRLFAERVGVNGVSIDPDIDLKMARDELQPIVAVQGNIAPDLLVAGGGALQRRVEGVLDRLQGHGKGHVMGVGHGIRPDTPVSHVEAFVNHVRAWKKGGTHGYDARGD